MAEESVQIEKLTNEESFQIWNFQLIVVLKANGLYEVVNEECVYVDMKNDEEKNAWKRKDAKAQKLIVMSVDKQHMMHIINCEKASEMYKKLKHIFQKSTQDQVCNLLQQFYNCIYEKGADMSVHISKIENLAHRLKALKQTIDENMIISKILSTLPENYKHFITAWESTSITERTLTNLTARLLSEENRGRDKEGEGAVAFSSSEKFCFKCKSKDHTTKYCKKGSEGVKCFKCGKAGHYARNCFAQTSGRENRERLKQCSICKKNNHLEKDCFFRKNRHDQGQDRVKGNGPEGRKIAFLTESKGNLPNFDNTFVVDSGCSAHMSNFRDLFTTMLETKSNITIAKKNEFMKSEGKGSIEGSKCFLKDVLYVPELTKNLLSVNAITENDGEVIFSKDKVVVMKNDLEVLNGIKENGLYIVKIHESEEGLFVEEKKNKCEEWHRKLGHLGIGNMKKLLEISEGIKLKKTDGEIEKGCETCLQAKQVRLPFNTIRQKATRPLEILHTDVCGPIDPETWNGKRYVLTILDDFTHFCKVYLLKNKNEVSEYLKEFIRESEASKNVKVSKIRCDNGGEYTHTDFKTSCKSKGIILDFTIPYSPQLNGKAERLNRTLLEKARALIFDSGMEKEMWGEALYVAAYLTNRSPTETIDVTPVEKWTGRIPNLSNLQIFGSEAHAKVLGYVKKLDVRSKKYKFVGYALNGYRLWDEKDRSIKTYRDVVFKEPKKSEYTKVRLKLEEETNHEENYKVEQESAEESEESEEEEEKNELNQTVLPEVLPLGEGNEDIPTKEQNREENKIRQSQSGRKITLPKKLQDYDLESEEFAMISFEEATNGPDKNKWKLAIEEEKKSLKENHTWILTDKKEATDRKLLTSRWIFRIKDDGKYKARLVVRGFEQKYGIDYKDTFSPVCNMSSIRILLALAARRDYNIIKFDIKTAFLYGNLDEEIFMEIPEGYQSKDNLNQVCLLKKALYGLKQAPLKWNEKFSTFLKDSGLISLKSEQCLFKNKTNTLMLAIHVDDGIVVSNDPKETERLLKNLLQEFKFEVYEAPRSFLGIEIKREENFIGLKQTKYIKTVLQRFEMQNAKAVSTPMNYDPKMEEKQERTKYFPYREAIGSLLYLTDKTRPDLSFAVNFCSRKVENPTDQDITIVKRILRYLLSSENNGITYKKECDENKLVAYSDSDFAGDITTRKSTTGYIIMFCEGPISWCSRRQPVVSLSTTEAEYIAAAECVKELLYLKTVIDELTNGDIKMDLNVDNQSSIKLIKNGQFNKRSKHIDVRYYFINEKVQEGLINLKYCESENQIADILTKPLNVNKFNGFKKGLMQDLK